jgi:hypothetical protein
MAETRPEDGLDPSGHEPEAHARARAAQPPAPLGGNRPAAGSRAATSPDAAWQPGPGATDFLGLEPELRGASGAGAEGPTESWLFDIEQADAGQAATSATATATEELEPASSDAEAFEGGDEAEPAPYGEGADESTDGGSDRAPRAAEQPARAGGARRLALAAAACALLAAGGWYAWHEHGDQLRGFVGRFLPADAELAGRPAPTPPAEPAGARPSSARPSTARSDAAAESPATNPDAAAAASAPTPAPETASATASGPGPSDAPIAGAPHDLAAGAPPDAPARAPTTDLTSALPEGSTGAPPAPASSASAPATAEPGLALSRDAASASRDARLPADEPGPGGGRRATARDLAGLWFEPTIPTHAIAGPSRLHTPNVGLVRAELLNGEFLEGRLHAVGEDRIWIDVDLGRMALDAVDLRGLVQIVGQQGAPLPAGSQAIAGLPRVEILLPGGSLVGRIVGREGDEVTFVTETGLRMRVEPLDIRPASDGRSRLIGRVGQVRQP